MRRAWVWLLCSISLVLVVSCGRSTPAPRCGNGIVELGEECDDANQIASDRCTNACLKACCGDGILWIPVEECDDGNLIATDECTHACKHARCGDAVVWAGREQCDQGPLNSDTRPDFCRTDCQSPACGGECSPGCDSNHWCEPFTGRCEPTCTPICSDDYECGNDGCGWTCGECEPDMQCLGTLWGRKCSLPCVAESDCWDGAICVFNVCMDPECSVDTDCGDADEFYCDKYLHCASYIPCVEKLDCPHLKRSGRFYYCDKDRGVCALGGDCWDSDDCLLGATCGDDHWCTVPYCSAAPEYPGCPPHIPVCDYWRGEELCGNRMCIPCSYPCMFDSECDLDLDIICKRGRCSPYLGYRCFFDSDCPAGQYCNADWCEDYPTPCIDESDCSGPYELCIIGFCFEFAPEGIQECTDDSECTYFEGWHCDSGLCKPIQYCVDDSHCANGMYCYMQECRSESTIPECQIDSDCPAGQICEHSAEYECVDPPECFYSLQCPDGYVCEDRICYNDMGKCAWVEKGPDYCNDDDPSTEDSCDPDLGCVNTPL